MVWNGGIRRPWHSGQSGHASPEPVERTTAPSTISPNVQSDGRSARAARRPRRSGRASFIAAAPARAPARDVGRAHVVARGVGIGASAPSRAPVQVERDALVGQDRRQLGVARRAGERGHARAARRDACARRCSASLPHSATCACAPWSPTGTRCRPATDTRAAGRGLRAGGTARSGSGTRAAPPARRRAIGVSSVTLSHGMPAPITPGASAPVRASAPPRARTRARAASAWSARFRPSCGRGSPAFHARKRASSTTS